jgi:hypothetical protein
MAKRETKDQDEARAELEQLLAYARNAGSASLEALGRSLAKRLGVEVTEEEIEKRRA